PVADAPDGLQVAGVGGVKLYLLAQPAHVHGDGACVSGEGVTPHQHHQLVAGVDPAWTRGKVVQKVELTCRERRWLSPDQDLARVRVYAQPVEREDLLIYISGRIFHAPQDRGDPRGKLAGG